MGFLDKIRIDLLERFSDPAVKLIGSLLFSVSAIFYLLVTFSVEIFALIYLLFDLVQEKTFTLFLFGLVVVLTAVLFNITLKVEVFNRPLTVIIVFGFFICMLAILGWLGVINERERLDNTPSIVFISHNPVNDPISQKIQEFVHELNIIRPGPTIKYEILTIPNHQDGLINTLNRVKREYHDIVIINYHNPFNFSHELRSNIINPRTLYLIVGSVNIELLPKNSKGEILSNIITLFPPLIDEVTWLIQRVPKDSPVIIVKGNDNIGERASIIANLLLEQKGINVFREIYRTDLDDYLYNEAAHDNIIYIWLDWNNNPPSWLFHKLIIPVSHTVINSESKNFIQPKVSPFLNVNSSLNNNMLNNIVAISQTFVETRFAGPNQRSIDIRTNVLDASNQLNEKHLAYLSKNLKLIHRPIISEMQ